MQFMTPLILRARGSFYLTLNINSSNSNASSSNYVINTTWPKTAVVLYMSKSNDLTGYSTTTITHLIMKQY